MSISQKHIKSLELDKVLNMLAEQATCEDSKKLCQETLPNTNYPQVVRDNLLTADAHSLTARFGTPTVLQMKNCLGSVRRAELGSGLTPLELLRIEQVLKAFKNLNQWSKHFEGEDHAIKELFSLVLPIKDLETAISNAIISEEEISDRASTALADIRRKIASAGSRVRTQLDSMIKSSAYQKYLQESIVTIRDGRFVVPVKAEFKNEVKGLVHDTSSSGATLFVEPMGVVEANNEIKVLKNKEQQEIERILAELSAMVGEKAEQIKYSYEAAVDIDVILSKARLAYKMNGNVVEIKNDATINLVKARHPLIEKTKVVPTTISLGIDFDTLVITGPNTGGKTVSIKTLGLLTLMAMCGLLLPVSDGSHVSVFENVLADIGDEQSIEQSLSTFSGHMTNIVSILEKASNNSLILVDELGAGTDPIEGAALAVAIIEALRNKGAKIAATTHYAEIKMYALETKGVENACCEFDVATLKPTYKLLIGVPGRSNAFAISSRLGMADSVIERAKELVSTENIRFEDVVSKLEGSRQQMEKARIEAEHYKTLAERTKTDIENFKESLEKEKDQELERARAKARAIVETVNLKALEMMDELEQIRKEKESEDFSQMAVKAKGQFKANMRKLHELADPVTGKVNRNIAPPPRPFKKGDLVKLFDINREGTVISEPDSSGNVMVQAGIMKTKVHISNLIMLDKKEKTTTLNSGSISIKGITSAKDRETKQEINLIGKNCDEALMELDRFIDNATLSHFTFIHIIHGKGTGILRKAVHQHLRKHRNIRTFRLGTYGEGESGVTIAELK